MIPPFLLRSIPHHAFDPFASDSKLRDNARDVEEMPDCSMMASEEEHCNNKNNKKKYFQFLPMVKSTNNENLVGFLMATLASVASVHPTELPSRINSPTPTMKWYKKKRLPKTPHW